MNTIVVVDLPSFYSGYVKSLRAKRHNDSVLKDFFLSWLDFRYLIKKAATKRSMVLGIWVFYSQRKIGPSGGKITPKELKESIPRFNKGLGVTMKEVAVKGEKNIYCRKCKREIEGEMEFEKGVDMQIAAHLFKTVEYWDSAWILSHDSDFVPIVNALREKGKLVHGIGFADELSSEGLREACYQYIDVTNDVEEEIRLFNIFREGGILERFSKIAELDKAKEFLYTSPTEGLLKERLDDKGPAYRKPLPFALTINFLPTLTDEEEQRIKDEIPEHTEAGKGLIEYFTDLDPHEFEKIYREHSNRQGLIKYIENKVKESKGTIRFQPN